MKKKVILMGSPKFALPTFEAINNSEFKVVALYCQSDKKRGRGQAICSPDCKNFSIENNIPVFQPETLKDDKVFEEYKGLNPDLTVVVAYGKLLPKRFLNTPKFSTINVHSSLLPELRGAAPINWALVRGYKKTGITVIKISPKLDSGDILFQKEVDIGTKENAMELHDRLSRLSGDIILDVIRNIFSSQINFKPQNDDLATYAPIIKKEDGKIDFNSSGEEIYNLIRGFYPWPSGHTFLTGKLFKILSATLLEKPANIATIKPGTLYDVPCGLVVLKDSVLKLEQVQIEGKKVMPYKTFICGFNYKNKKLIFG